MKKISRVKTVEKIISKILKDKELSIKYIRGEIVPITILTNKDLEKMYQVYFGEEVLINDSIETGNMLEDIKRQAAAREAASNEFAIKQEIELEKKVKKLQPIYDKLKELEPLGIIFEFSNRPNHYPYPAIHLSKGRGYLNNLDEIYYFYDKELQEDRFGMGTCNTHLYKSLTFDKLIETVNSEVLNAIARGKIKMPK